MFVAARPVPARPDPRNVTYHAITAATGTHDRNETEYMHNGTREIERPLGSRTKGKVGYHK